MDNAYYRDGSCVPSYQAFFVRLLSVLEVTGQFIARAGGCCYARGSVMGDVYPTCARQCRLVSMQQIAFSLEALEPDFVPMNDTANLIQGVELDAWRRPRIVPCLHGQPPK